MSECVVRMKTPSSCYVCPLRIACVLYKKWLANEADMPCVYDDGCLIICQLPEGHGRLVDADALERNMFAYAAPEMLWDRGDIEHKIDEMSSIVPAAKGEKK